jgi:putative membrane protein
MRVRSGWWALALVVTGGASCAAGADEEDRATATPAAVEAAATDGGALNDAEIAAVVVAANSIDVSYGEIARQRATDERVKEFAETMISDHTAVNASAVELVSRLGVTPEENEVSRSLQSSATRTRDSLRAMSSADFDLGYIRNEVAYHRAVLDALDTLLIPNATNAELRETLVGVRPAFVAHLEHAEALQRALEET